jgi:SPP1 family predicted phage head-tail adaptor
MIRSGKLDRQITLMRKTETVSESGAVTAAWTEIATVRAELVQQSADEYLAGFGAAEQGALIFRIRYIAGITTADRLIFGGEAFDIDQIAELGRRRGLELRVSGGAA